MLLLLFIIIYCYCLYDIRDSVVVLGEALVHSSIVWSVIHKN